MEVTRESKASGIVRTLDLDVTEEQINNYQHGALVQKAFPNLSDDEREFIITGITKEEWDDIFAEEAK